MKKEFKYKFSVIMSLYNVEEYFEEAIDSLINQTIDFQESIQVILVNDGSPDNVESFAESIKSATRRTSYM